MHTSIFLEDAYSFNLSDNAKLNRALLTIPAVPNDKMGLDPNLPHNTMAFSSYPEGNSMFDIPSKPFRPTMDPLASRINAPNLPFSVSDRQTKVQGLHYFG